MAGETEAERMLRAQREWQRSRPDAPATASIQPAVISAIPGQPAPLGVAKPAGLSRGVKVGIGVAGVAVAIVILGSIDDPVVPECMATRPAMFNTQYAYNSCDFPVNAIVCTEFPFGRTGGSCDGTAGFAPGATYSLMAAEQSSILMTTITPSRVWSYPCRATHYPVLIDRSANSYRCEKL